MREYRIVTNGTWYELEYTYWWLPFWFRYEPHQYERHGYQPIDESQFKFSSISEAREKIKELKRKQNQEKWIIVDEHAKDGRLQEGKTRSNKKEYSGGTKGPVPPAPQKPKKQYE
jgi:hypothetical protein